MPPRRVKAKAHDAETIENLKLFENYINQSFDEAEESLKRAAQKVADSEVIRLIELIPEEFRSMALADFLTCTPPIDLFFRKPVEKEVPQEPEHLEQTEYVEQPEEPVEKENEPEIHDVKPIVTRGFAKEPEHHEKEPESESHADEMDTDDAAHETSIPIVHSGQNSGRSTATDDTRHQLTTPAGHVLTVPQAIYPKILNGVQPFRLPHLDEEIAFSVNGSPMILPARREGREDRRAEALKGNLEPKIEPGTAV